ncbi:MAG: hydrophobic protein [Actinomycetota bacterium]
MGLILAVLLLIIILGALGFALKLLWIVALVLLAIWLIGFVVRGAEGARWYRW